MWKLTRSESVGQLYRLPQRCFSSKKNIQVLNPSAAIQPFKADLKNVLERKPVWVKLEPGKEYKWCACGRSNNQPWCDDKKNFYCHDVYTNLPRPVIFKVDKEGEYCLCMCKQTNKRPLCDGTHKTIDQKPRSEDAVELCMQGDSPVYDGVAHKLGYRPKEDKWQK
uniref:Iron-binding zinc finger CDGSH type domain-containing protein n=1 Tax=Acrobeloides nanus TaxID=290746 RepID=A0A914DU43_9BILA